MDSPKAVQSTLASMLLLNYSMSVFLPPWLTLVSLFESVVCPLVAISLVCSFVYVKLVRRSTSTTGVASLKKGKEVEASSSQRDESPEPALPGQVSTALFTPLAVIDNEQLKSPSVSKKLLQALPDTITKGLELYHSTQWKHKLTKNDVTFEEMPSPYCDKKACRFTCRIPNMTAYAVERLLEKRFVKAVDDTSSIYQTLYKSPVFGVSGRDMVACLTPKLYVTDLETQRKLGLLSPDDTRTVARPIFLQAATDEGKNFPAESKFVRGAIHRFLVVAREEEDSSLTLTMTMNVDPQGIIPARVVELTNAEQCQKLAIMRNILAHDIGAVQPSKPEDLSPLYSVAEPIVGASSASAAAAAAVIPLTEPSSPSLPSAISGIMVDDIDDNVTRAVDLLLKESWVRQQAKDGVTYYAATIPWCDKKAVRVEMFVPNVKAHALDRVINNAAHAKSYDRLLSELKVVRDVTDRVHIVHSMYKSPVMGIAARDFVTKVTPKTYLNAEQLASLHMDTFPSLGPGGAQCSRQGVAFVHCGSDAHSEIPPVPKFTRGVVHCFGLFANSEDGDVLGVTLIQVSSMDPCGKIPRSLVDATNAEQMEKLKIIAKLMQHV
eukprot:CAMPEP_0176437262 /NCGR_PEP_ID=MMETSP0127-20121128/18502_1 /TAXON_ID=938130 /ORGANISM="Platyophrya macrostoma, Strain WH" /LENGTH=605 /DNA_ID=CAMNT_0017820825 /DNA_START=45 /DNA_END=1862 /DNA_ORIENTATION=+